MPRKPYTPSFGSISSGTMLAEDLIPAFASELEAILNGMTKADRPEAHVALVAEATTYAYIGWSGVRKSHHYESGEDSNKATDEADGLLEALFDALNEYAPPYGYFGAHPGDGADFGFWLHEDFEYDFDGLKVSDTSEVPADYSGEVLHVNDHGNCTLYAAQAGSLTEIWAIV